MKKNILVIIAVSILFALIAAAGCTNAGRGLYSSYAAEECFEAHGGELEAASELFMEDPNIWIVLRGIDRHFTDRVFTQIDGYSIFSDSELSGSEIEAIRERVIPAFGDERLGSIRRHPEGFAEYVWFFYRHSIFDNCYLISREISRSYEGELTDLSYITDRKELANGWYAIRYSS